jgi:hypothetical protein
VPGIISGSWIVRAAAGDRRSYWTEAFAATDDYAGHLTDDDDRRTGQCESRHARRHRRFRSPANWHASPGEFHTLGHVSLEEGFAVSAIAKVHPKVLPLTSAKDAHPPEAIYGIAELPEDMVPVLVAEAFIARLKYRRSESPRCGP